MSGNKRVKQLFGVLAVLALLVAASNTVLAQSLSSPSYLINESYVGPGGSNDGSSTNYSAAGTIGDLGAGGTDSTGFSAVEGFNTTAEPTLSMIVNTSSVSLGGFSTSVATTATATFSVLNYTAYGYSVYMTGTPPTNGSHTLTNLSSNAASQVGVEQFGINLKANTSPITYGSDPVQVPDNTFSSGAAATNYDTANSYRYVSGEKVAQASKSSGQTNYTISYLVNMASSTPQGAYSGSQGLIIVGTY